MSVDIASNQAVEKEQASRCCTADAADVYLHQSVNQLYNNHKMAKLFFFSLLSRNTFIRYVSSFTNEKLRSY